MTLSKPFAAAAVAVLILSTAGCASRAAPFDTLDKAQITILKLQQPAPPQAQPQAGGAGCPQIPGLPPELQQACQQALDAFKATGIIPPGMQIPGLTPPAAAAPPPPQLPMFRQQWAIGDQRPVMDEALREELLDLFGDAESFNDQRGQCFAPGMAISFQTPQQPEPIDVVISFSCNQAVGYGFQWPHPQSGLSATTYQALQTIYQNHFGPIPPGA